MNYGTTNISKLTDVVIKYKSTLGSDMGITLLELINENINQSRGEILAMLAIKTLLKLSISNSEIMNLVLTLVSPNYVNARYFDILKPFIFRFHSDA